MTVNTIHAVKQYNGAGGGLDTFPVDFQFFDDIDLKVILINALGAETVQTIAVNYDVTGGKDAAGHPGTGSVIMNTPPAVGEKLRIERVTPFVQQIDFNLGSNFNPETVEAGLDRDRVIDQEVALRGGLRDVKLSIFDYLAGFNPELPVAAPGKFIKFNTLGTGFDLSSGLTWRGPWVLSTPYVVDELVENIGSSWICKQAHTASADKEPGVGGSYAAFWDLAAQKGDIGLTGDAGVDAGIPWTFDSSIVMADPGTGDFRLNSATLSAVTSMAVSYSSGLVGNPSVANWVKAWDDSTTASIKGTLILRDQSAPDNFAIYNITALADNTTWAQVTLSYVTHSGSLLGLISIQFSRAGDKGTDGAVSFADLDAHRWSTMTDVASAATTDIGAIGSMRIRITGTVTITSLGTTPNCVRLVTFDNILILTHNGATLDLPGVANIQTSATAWGIFVSDASGNWSCLHFVQNGGQMANANSFINTIGTNYWGRSNVASAATTNLAASNNPIQTITGTTTITSFGTNASRWRLIIMAASLTLTHNAASLILPTGANIVTQAGDSFVAASDVSGNWSVYAYQRADGTNLATLAHTHVAADITDFTEASQDVVGNMLVASEGTGDLDFTYNDGANTLNAVVKNDAITFAKFQNITTDRLLGRDTAASGDVEEISVGGGLEFSGATAIQRSALTGDVTATAGSNATTIANDAVTFAKFQNITDARLLGRNAGSAGDMQEITLGTNLSFSGTTLNAAGGTQKYVNRNFATYTANTNIATDIPLDDTIPQITEGTEIVTATITPTSASNRVRVRFSGFASNNGACCGTGTVTVALFQDATANALTAVTHRAGVGASSPAQVTLEHEYVPGTTSTITLRIRTGRSGGGNLRYNGTNTARYFGGVAAATLVLEEITP